MCFFRAAFTSSFDRVVVVPSDDSQAGSWLCHRSVWPRTSCLFFFAKATIWSAFCQV
ncbi:hypothetical protein M1L60_37035 [Actinoplanes sp. TRM 88003]|uniref:Uncharacterized protein n=1 Tax=Paractinoplanes aksuensis TaxID=2939490 RepID=A0ABT1DZ81_9ACTN|nr:hypothetical protein [Actinoplanes aksuensis]MCO8276198.1 hypothetical protein [Actinoplanes aksuensis]